MTIWFYSIRWADSDGRLFSGQVCWDKLHQGKILASICPLTAPSYAEEPIWCGARCRGASVRNMG
jgi:hypothetical protein